jgi:hypothetical protein
VKEDAQIVEGSGAVFGSDSELAVLVARRDWAATPLGALDGWPQSLRTTVSIMLNTRFPMFLFWGPQAVGSYSDAYRPSLGGKHPKHSASPGWSAGRTSGTSSARRSPR